jgi:hypothetical protein
MRLSVRFGIESHGIDDTELRRMYLGYRGLGIAQRMLDCAQAKARALGFTKMIVSTAQIQKAAEDQRPIGHLIS